MVKGELSWVLESDSAIKIRTQKRNSQTSTYHWHPSLPNYVLGKYLFQQFLALQKQWNNNVSLTKRKKNTTRRKLSVIFPISKTDLCNKRCQVNYSVLLKQSRQVKRNETVTVFDLILINTDFCDLVSQLYSYFLFRFRVTFQLSTRVSSVFRNVVKPSSLFYVAD